MINLVQKQSLLVESPLVPSWGAPALPRVENVIPSDREALVTILTQPKNSIISQYKYMFTLDDSALVFTDDALDAIAELAIKKRTGKYLK